MIFLSEKFSYRFSLLLMSLGDAQALRQIKLPVYTSSQPVITPFFLTISSPCSCTRRRPRTSLGGYFHSRKCWVTTGSTSSQQSGLKFNASPDAYFIVLCPLSITLYPSGCLSLIASPPLSAGNLFSIFVHLQSPGLRAANCRLLVTQQ